MVKKNGNHNRTKLHPQIQQEGSKAHIHPVVAIRGCNTFREKTKLSKISKS